MFEENDRKWAEMTFGMAPLGDQRRVKRLHDVGATLAANPGASLNGAFADDAAGAEGAQRLIRSEAVSAEAIFEGASRATALAAAMEPGVLLALEDTTTLAFPHASARSMGDLGGPERSRPRGFFVHSVLLYGMDRQSPVGLIDQQRWERHGPRGKKHARKIRPYEEKESVKWQRASEAMRAHLDSDTLARTISVADRESDVWEYLVYKISHGERFVVRASWNRCILDEDARHLTEKLETLDDLAQIDVAVSAKGSRPARTARVTVRAGEVTLKRPSRPQHGDPNTLRVGVVHLVEEHPPEGAEALDWKLYTSEPVETLDHVLFVVFCYRLRWVIEDWHKAWKSGCGVEKIRQRTSDRLEKLSVILGLTAVRLLQLRSLASSRPEETCTSVLTGDEWRCLWLSVEKRPCPDEPPSLEWAHLSLGRLGGFHDTQRTGRIGWMTLWKGWSRLTERIKGFHLARCFPEKCDE